MENQFIYTSTYILSVNNILPAYTPRFDPHILCTASAGPEGKGFMGGWAYFFSGVQRRCFYT